MTEKTTSTPATTETDSKTETTAKSTKVAPTDQTEARAMMVPEIKNDPSVNP